MSVLIINYHPLRYLLITIYVMFIRFSIAILRTLSIFLFGLIAEGEGSTERPNANLFIINSSEMAFDIKFM